MSVRRAPAGVALLALVVAGGGCTETDDSFQEVGVTRLNPVDPDLRLATLDDPKMQYASWNFSRAEFQIGDQLIDLRGNDNCTVFDTAVVTPSFIGKCGGGIVTGQTENPVSASLALDFTLAVRRAEPIDLQPQDDFDGDTVANGMDLCRLIPDPGQEDVDGNGIGDACEGINPFSGGVEIDNDGDAIVDSIDNCPSVQNLDQQDSTIPPDGIGDACPAQDADVTMAMSTDLQLNLNPGNFILPGPQTILVVVDFASGNTLTCNWAQGVCTLDPAAVRACYATSTLGGQLGCP